MKIVPSRERNCNRDPRRKLSWIVGRWRRSFRVARWVGDPRRTDRGAQGVRRRVKRCARLSFRGMKCRGLLKRILRLREHSGPPSLRPRSFLLPMHLIAQRSVMSPTAPFSSTFSARLHMIQAIIVRNCLFAAYRATPSTLHP